MKLFKPAPVSVPVSTALLLLRMVCGSAFVLHGYGKIQNPFGWMGDKSSVPGMFQALAAVSEFGGGLAWILGLLTPLASLGIGCTMVVALWFSAVVFHLPFVSKTGGASCELASVFLCVAGLLLLGGPGRFSLDWVLFSAHQNGAQQPQAEPEPTSAKL